MKYLAHKASLPQADCSSSLQEQHIPEETRASHLSGGALAVMIVRHLLISMRVAVSSLAQAADYSSSLQEQHIVLRGTIVNRTYDIHKKLYIDHFYQQYLVLLTMPPRNTTKSGVDSFSDEALVVVIGRRIRAYLLSRF